MINSSEKKLVLFDGVCNLCNTSIQFIIKHDKKKQFLFASLQGEKGQELLSKYNLPLNNFHSFVLIVNDIPYTQSTGVLMIFKNLSGGWKLTYALIIIPKFIRDAIYKWIAKNRYKWFGKKETCMVPTSETRDRFFN